MTDKLLDGYDVVVVGGGAAGLNGALMLARARRSVVVVDAGEPRNAPAEGVHGLLGHDGRPPRELLATGREEVRRYGGHVVDGRVEAATPAPGEDGGLGFAVTLDDGRSVRARRLLVTTGLVDELPAVPGLRERWGRDVIHCPYCHGWEVRERAIGVVASGPMSVHQALLFTQWSDDVTLFTHLAPVPDGEEAAQLAVRGVRIVEGPLAEVVVEDDVLTGVRLGDGTVVALEALVVAPRMVARTDFLAGLGLKAVEHPTGVGEHVPTADPVGRTGVPGVWVAGNVTDLSAQVGASAAAGATAGAQLNMELLVEETQLALAARARP
ncbi:NAD(P)/FAD-dependent oxidoreductase [Nocardioides iriomotensis]|uniref:NAD(P)/FAD-dependent oxidoreductase n=1 Tax=Nocardioides iriomotensis TaxID=715784 RepID=A0A4Q5J409_9ACTN|nr:NAD(P)/FAD-dependent oxidoreductase [Nocardioides iriomotensis]RYU12458.1 NAD(P)/FAD-dependent oxidoreductase [Nocardioides iriomotensis]